MKRCGLFAVLFLLLSLLCACAQTPTMDLSGFLLQRKRNHQPLDFAQVYQLQNEAETEYYVPVSDRVSLRLFCLATGELYECRVMLQKIDHSGQPLPVTDDVHRAFLAECRAVLHAFCSFSQEEAEKQLHALSLYEDTVHRKTGLLTSIAGPFTLQMQSHPLETVLSVRHNWLKETDTTVMPESHPLFDETTATRKETVPHR